jgi:hypothetical protein
MAEPPWVDFMITPLEIHCSRMVQAGARGCN